MTVEKLQRFAAECQAMAHRTRNPEDRDVWTGLAQRWLQCAALVEREELDSYARRRTSRKAVH